jgi:hypothetical protein
MTLDELEKCAEKFDARTKIFVVVINPMLDNVDNF